jgi:alpha-tubulin N-acetyltransferase 1
VVGILKTGEKSLFYRDGMGDIKEMNPTCVLDFYVHESYQRSGFGKNLFIKMLEYENTQPEKLAYDRPSPKLLGFLRKHYSLSNYIPQNNNFVIFDKFFNSGYQSIKSRN